MSLGCSIGDVISLTQLAWNTVSNSQKACGEHDEVTRELSSLHIVLKRLEREVARPESPINKPGDSFGEEIEVLAGGCRRVIRILDQVLEKYNALSEIERSGRKLWQKVKFGNGQMADLADFRSKILYYTSAISLLLNMISIGTVGSVERQMNEAGGDIKDIKQAVNGITAHLIARDRPEGSVLTTYPDDDKVIWKQFRRELVEDGFSSSVIGEHKHLIKAYIKELGDRGLLDDTEPQASNELPAHGLLGLENTSSLTTSADTHIANPRSSTPTLPPAERDGTNVEMSSEEIESLLSASKVQSEVESTFLQDMRSDVDSNLQPIEQGVSNVQDVRLLSESPKGTALTSSTERPRHLHCRETSPVEHPNAKNSITYPCPDTQTLYPVEYSRKESSPNLYNPCPGVEAAVQTTGFLNEENNFSQETACSHSPADIIRTASDVWYQEFLSTSQYPNICPSLRAKHILRTLLSTLKSVDIEAVGWSLELKACRTSLIKQLNMRLNNLDRRGQMLRKHHICRPRCFCLSDTSDNAKANKEKHNSVEPGLDLAGEHQEGALLKFPLSRLNTPRRLEISTALHRMWHNHHDEAAPLCLEWVNRWGRDIREQGKVRKLLPMNVDFMNLVVLMHKNKQSFDALDLGQNMGLKNRRLQLGEDIKVMVSSLRIYKSDMEWTWKRSGHSSGQRVYIDISWVKRTIASSPGTKCTVCASS